MTQEEKNLLLKDLSTRLPYGVIVRHADPLIDNDNNETGEFWYKRGYLCDITTLDDMTTTIIESEGSDNEGYEHICFLEKTVPYLRSMSSMTEEEQIEWYNYHHEIELNEVKSSGDYLKAAILGEAASIDWLNAHHFDYRGLIEKRLAIAVTKENNPYEN